MLCNIISYNILFILSISGWHTHRYLTGHPRFCFVAIFCDPIGNNDATLLQRSHIAGILFLKIIKVLQIRIFLTRTDAFGGEDSAIILTKYMLK